VRPIIAILISVVVLGGVGAFIAASTARRVPDATVFEQTAATGVFSLEITPTFDAEADPFALDLIALQVQHAGNTILRRDDKCAANETLLVTEFPENVKIIVGKNELYIQAFPGEGALAAANAVRIRVFRDGQPITDNTIWSEPGAPVEGTILVDVRPSVAASAGEH